MNNETEFSFSVLRKRLLAVFLAITFLFCLFLARFFYVQVIWTDTLHAKAVDQWTREIPVVAERGKIYDRNGEVLVGNQTAYSIFSRASAVKNAETAAKILSPLIGLSYERTLEKLKDRSGSEITLVRGMDKRTAQKLEGENLSGVYYARDNLRLYPYGELLEQVLGFTSFDRTGVTGLELYYDEFLSGKKGEILYETDLVGVELEEGAVHYLPATDGLNLRLTIDYRIQSLAESVMQEALENSHAKATECIVMDPNDGAIVAMVNLPSFDLNEIPRDDINALNALTRNRAVSDIYEPGSTFKIITSAMNIEEYYRGNPNALPLDHVYSSARTRSVDGTTIKCWSDHKNGKHANETLADALNNSCNPCFVDIALALGKETFYDYLDAFKFGHATGIDFSGESVGMLLPESSVRDCDVARIGFGQTIAVSPLQLISACASSINGGKYYSPRLVSEIFSDDGSVREVVPPNFVGEVISEKSSRLLASMLEGVVRDGSGKKAFIEGYRIGGKTGTAQKYEGGHIAEGKYVSSFLGFFPSEAPQYIALFIIDEPEGVYYGSAIAAPCAEKLFRGIGELTGFTPKENL